MSGVEVPAAAVEAGARAVFLRAYDSEDWGAVPDRTRKMYLRDARTTLEAALPFLWTTK